MPRKNSEKPENIDIDIPEVSLELWQSDLSPSKEAFCRYIVEDGYKPQDAFIRAFNFDRGSLTPKSFVDKVSRLLNSPEIVKRLGELQKDVALRTVITADRLIVETYDILQEAKGKRQYKAAVDAARLLMQALGMLVERHEVQGKISIDELAMVAEQRKQIIEGEFRDLDSELEDVVYEPKELPAPEPETEAEWFRRNMTRDGQKRKNRKNRVETSDNSL